MRKDTQGGLHGLTSRNRLRFIGRDIFEYMQRIESTAREVLKQYQRHVEEVARRKAESEAILREADELMAANLARMPPAKAAAYRSFYEAMRSAQNKGTFSFGELMRLAGGDREVLTPIIEDAMYRLMNDLESKD